MPLLNSRQNDFRFVFPVNWFHQNVAEKYEPLLKRFEIPFETVESYINWSIQSVTFPAFKEEVVTQESRHHTRTYNSGFDARKLVETQVTVEFRLVEGFLNYWIMQDQWLSIHRTDHERVEGEHRKMPPVRLMIFDPKGYLLLMYLLRGITYSGLSQLELSASSNKPEFRTFSCTFYFDEVIINQEYDNLDLFNLGGR